MIRNKIINGTHINQHCYVLKIFRQAQYYIYGFWFEKHPLSAVGGSPP
jgi:hypothetical protein